MNPQIWLAGTGLSIFALAALTVYLLLIRLFSKDRRVSKRIDELADYGVAELADIEPLALPFFERIVVPAIDGAKDLAHRFTPNEYRDTVIVKLAAAGRLQAVPPEQIILVKLGLFGLGVVAGIIIAMLNGAGVILAVLIGAGAGLLFFYIPGFQMSSWATSRREQIVRELPDMLDMLTISVQAGLGFDQAVDRYIKYSVGPLADEFAIALKEIQAGKTRRDAFREMAERAGEPSLRAFVMAIVQADVFGVSVNDVLRTQSRELRVKRRQAAEEQAQKAPAKMTLPLMGCLLPTIMLVVMTPAAVGIIEAFSQM